MLNAPSRQSRRQSRWWAHWAAWLGLAGLLLLPGHPAHAAHENLGQGNQAARAGPARAPNWASSGDFGGVGLLQNRTARFRDDGDIDVGGVRLEPYRRYYISFQAMPWLEGTFRYTEITNRSFSLGGLASTEAFQDRGADLKFLLLEEGAYTPQLAFGLQDGIGTGLFASEFLVASKAYYDLDFSFGAGWGYLASGSNVKNPLASLSNIFRSRTSTTNGGGQTNFSSYLSGETIGLFGGVAWRTPLKGLSLKLEASSQDYQSEPLSNSFKKDLPFNAGFVYRPFPWLELSGAYERGNIAMFRASMRANVEDPGVPKFDPPPPKLTPRPRQTARAGGGADGGAGGGAGAWTGDAGFSLAPKLAGRLIQPGDPEALAPHPRFARQQTRQQNHQQTRQQNGGARAAREDRTGDLTGDAAIVDYLFDSLEGKGFTVQSIDFSHRRARLVVSQMPGMDGDGERAAAAIVFNAAPTPIQQVEIVQLAAADLGGGRPQSRAVVRRGDVRRNARIDQMFDGLEASGFRVESLELSRGAARVYLSAAGGRRANDHTNDRAGDWAAAQLIADHAPMQVSSVEVVRLVAGVEATRVTLRRGGPSQSARSAPDTHNAPDGLTAGPEAARVGAAGGAGGLGAAGGSFIADLTDNEKNALALRIFADLEAADFTVDKFEISRRKATVYLTPTKFREHARNVGRASRVIANHAPGSVEEIEVVTMNAGLETARVKILRKDLEAAVQRRGSAEEIWARTDVSGPRASPPFDRLRRGEGRRGEDRGGDGGALTAIANPRRYPTLGWDVRPALRSHIGGPDALYLYQIWLAMSGSAELYRGLFVDATVGKNITTTLDQITLNSDSQLPHVRSDLRHYAQEGEDGNIVRLQAEYLFQPAEDIFARVSAGLFEEMFGGVGGELLYRPYGSRLALGVELNRVRQRAYDQRLDFRDYEVTTGHMNVYYKMPYMGLTGEIHAGQFLAGDRGAQFALLREFNSGIAIGAWATFTNVSAAEFGEGSFDKGIFLHIPFEAFLTTSSLRGGALSFRPLTRDGGQILNMQRRLYGVTEGGNLNNVAHKWNRFLD